MDFLEDRAVPATISWLNPAGGAWETGSNWNLGRAPVQGDDVFINIPTNNPTITFSNPSNFVQLNSLNTSERLDILAGQLTFAGGNVTASAALNLNGGTFGGGALTSGTTLSIGSNVNSTIFNLTVNAGATVDLGTYNGSATFSNLKLFSGMTLNGTLKLGNAASATDSTLTIGETETIGGTGSIVFGTSTSNLLKIGSNTTLTIDTGITVRGQSGRIGRASGDTTTVNAALVNRGTISSDVLNGVLNVIPTSLTGASASKLVAANGGSIFINASWSTSGAVQVNSASSSFWVFASFPSSSLANLSSVGDFQIRSGATMTNTGSTLTATSSTGLIKLFGGTIVGGTLATAGAGSFSLVGTLDGVTIGGTASVPREQILTINNGLTVNGTLTLGSSVASSGSSGSTLRFSTQAIQTLGGTGSVVGDSGVAGFNSIDPVVASGVLTIGPSLTVSGGPLSLGSTAVTPLPTIVNQGAIQANVSGKIVTQNVNVRFRNEGLVEASGGTFQFRPDQTDNFVASQAELTGGRWKASGTGILSLLSINATVSTLNAELTLSGASARFYTGGSGGTLPAMPQLSKIGPTGSLIVDSGATFTTGSALQINKRLEVGLNSVVTTAGATVASGGSVRLSGFDNNTRLNMSAGSVVVQSGGLIEGSGQIGGSVTNSGTVSPGVAPARGILTISGTYAQTSTGVLSARITSVGASKLAVTGAATLAGTFGAAAVAGFTPTVGSTYNVMTFGSRSGSFASMLLDSGTDPFFTPTFASTFFDLRTAETNVAPSLAAIGPISGNEGTAIGFTAAGSDQVGDTLTYTLIGAPSGATIGSSSGVLAWTPTELQDGTYAFVVRATDNGVNRDGSPNPLFAERTVQVTVNEVNQPPSIPPGPTLAAVPGVALAYNVFASDADRVAGQAQTLSYALSGAFPTGATIDPQGVIRYTPADGVSGTFNFFVEVSDGTATASLGFTIQVAPVGIVGGVLYALGTSGADTFVVAPAPGDVYQIALTLNGTSYGPYPSYVVSGNAVVLRGLGGDDTFAATPGRWFAKVSFDGGEGSDAAAVMYSDDINVYGFGVVVSDTGATGTDTLDVYGTLGSDNFGIGAEPDPSGSSTNRIRAAGIESTTIDLGGGDDAFSLNSWSGGTVAILGGTGRNFIDVSAYGSGGFSIDGGGGGEELDTSVADDRDFLTIHGTSSADAMAVHAGSVAVNGRTFAYQGFEYLSILLDAGDDVATVDGFSVGGAVSVDSGPGSDRVTIELGSLPAAVPLYPGAYNSFYRTVSVNDAFGFAGSDSLIVRGSVGDDRFLLNNTSLSLGDPNAPTQYLGFGGYESISIEGLGGDDRFQMNQTSDLVALTVDGGDGSDVYESALASMVGPTVVNDTGTTGTDALKIQFQVLGDALTVTANGVSTDFGGGLVRSLGYGGVETIRIAGSGPTHFVVTGSGATGGLTLDQPGVYTNRATNDSTYAITLGALAGDVTIVDAEDDGHHDNPDVLTVYGTSQADDVTIESGVVRHAGHAISFSGIDALTVDGGAGNDALRVASVGSKGVTLVGGLDDDLFVVQLGALAGVVTVSDPGPAGVANNRLEVHGTAGDDLIRYTTTELRLGNPFTESVRYDSDAEVALDIYGGDGNDTIVAVNSHTRVYGEAGNDTIIVQSTAPGGGLIVDGGDGSDIYQVQLGALASPVSVADSGTGAGQSDTVTVVDPTNSQITVNAGAVTSGGQSVSVSGATVSQLTIDGNGGTGSVAVVGDPPAGVALLVTNLAPVFSLGGNASINEGSTFTRVGMFTDVDADQTWTATVDYGDGAGASSLVLAGDKSFQLSHLYEDDGDYVATVTITEYVGGVAGASTTRTINVRASGVAPTATAFNGGPAGLNQNVSIGLSGVLDAPADLLRGLKYSFDFDGDGTYEVVDASTPSVAHAFATAGAKTVKIKVADEDGLANVYTTVVTIVAPPTADRFVVNDGNVQRSLIKSVTVEFAGVVTTLDADAFLLVRQGGGTFNVVISGIASAGAGRTKVVLTFTGAGVQNSSLPDGDYTLTTRAAKVRDGFSQGLTAERVDSFFALFGDVDGDHDVDTLDYGVFRNAANKRVGQAGYLWYLDYDGSGLIDVPVDYAEFQKRRR